MNGRSPKDVPTMSFGSMEASQPSFTGHERNGQIKLLSFQEIPRFLQYNPFILTGYRALIPYAACVKTYEFRFGGLRAAHPGTVASCQHPNDRLQTQMHTTAPHWHAVHSTPSIMPTCVSRWALPQ